MEVSPTIENKYQIAFEKLNKSEMSPESKAFDRFMKMGIPSRKSEVYKYTNLSHFRNLNPDTSASIPHKLPEFFKHEYLDAYVLVTVNGVFSESLSNFEEEDGLIISCMCDARKDFRDIVDAHYGSTTEKHPDAFSELNSAFAQCGIFVYAKKNTKISKPILMVHLGYEQSDDVLCNQRNLVIVEEGAELNLVEDYLNLSETAAFNINHFSEYFVKDNAHLSVNIYQEESNKLYFIGNKFVEQGANSNVNFNSFNFEGQLVRNNFRVNLNGSNAYASLNGIFVNEGSVHTDNRILISHNAPHCDSSQNFKGILSDKATGVFNGKVYVAQDAQKTNAYQSNKNVLLSEEATIYTKPELEIYADDVKCSHGATSGQLDEEAIFYTMSRGIPRERAKALIVFAFAQEVVEDIKNEDFKAFIESRLIGKLKLNEYRTAAPIEERT